MQVLFNPILIPVNERELNAAKIDPTVIKNLISTFKNNKNKSTIKT